MSAVAPAHLAQRDFSAGEVRSIAPDLIPEQGAYKLRNSVLNNDGLIYRRGGDAYKSTAFGATGLTWIWDGYLAGGVRTVIARDGAFAVLAANDTSPVAIYANGLVGPVQAVEVQGILFIGGGYMYAGSRKGTSYSTGTVAATNGSPTLVGTGTSWASNVDAGMLVGVGAGQWYPVLAVQDNTHLTLAYPFTGTTAASVAYTASPMVALATSSATFKQAPIYATVADRLIACQGNQVFFSDRKNPASFPVNNVHRLLEGVEIVGAHAVGQTLFVFTTRGVWTINNMYYELVDEFGNPQQTIQRAGDTIAWTNEGICQWGDSLIVAAIDGIWALTPGGQTTLLSRGQGTGYTDYVRQGYWAGLATVYENHLFLPICSSTGNVDMLVCRLDRPVNTERGVIFPWAHWDGHAAQSCAVAVRKAPTPTPPRLLSAGALAESRVIDLTGCFAPTAANSKDADGSVHQWEMVTRDFTTGRMNWNLVKKLRVRYELVDAASDDPTIEVAYAVGERKPDQVTEWGLFDWGQADWGSVEGQEFFALAGSAPEDNGSHPFTWVTAVRCAYIRFRLQSISPAARLVLHSVELFIRQAGRL